MSLELNTHLFYNFQQHNKALPNSLFCFDSGPLYTWLEIILYYTCILLHILMKRRSSRVENSSSHKRYFRSSADQHNPTWSCMFVFLQHIFHYYKFRQPYSLIFLYIRAYLHIYFPCKFDLCDQSSVCICSGLRTFPFCIYSLNHNQRQM